MIDFDESGLYFLTAKGKSFYRRLCANPNIALTDTMGSDTMSTVAVSIKGKIEELGAAGLQDLFEKNPYMEDIYPSEESRSALTVFKLYEGTGEMFDLSKLPPEISANPAVIDQIHCLRCGNCYEICPARAVIKKD